MTRERGRAAWTAFLPAAAVAALLLVPNAVLLDALLPRSEVSVRYRDQYDQGTTFLKAALAALALAVAFLPWALRGGPPARAHAGCRFAPRRLLRDPWLWAITAAAALLRLPALFQPLQCDEYTSLDAFVIRSMPFTATYYLTTNNHILYNLVAHVLVGLFGTAPVVQRFPAFLAGLASIVFLYAAARLYVRRPWALAAAALAAATAIHVRYSTEARAYTVLVLGAALAVYLLALAGHTRRAGYAVGYGVATLLAAWAHPFLAFMTVVHAGAVAAVASGAARRRAAALFVLTGCGMAVLYAVPAAFYLHGRENLEPGGTPAGRMLELVTATFRDVASPYFWSGAAAWAWGALAAAGTVVLARRRPLLTVLLAGPVVPALLSAAAGPPAFGAVRFHLYLFPALVIGVAAALGRAGRVPGAAAAAALVAAGLASSGILLVQGRTDDRAVGEAVNARARSGDRLLVVMEAACGMHPHYVRKDVGFRRLPGGEAAAELRGGAAPRFVVVSRGGTLAMPGLEPLDPVVRLLEARYERIAGTRCVDPREYYAHEVWMRRD